MGQCMLFWYFELLILQPSLLFVREFKSVKIIPFHLSLHRTGGFCLLCSMGYFTYLCCGMAMPACMNVALTLDTGRFEHTVYGQGRVVYDYGWW